MKHNPRSEPNKKTPTGKGPKTPVAHHRHPPDTPGNSRETKLKSEHSPGKWPVKITYHLAHLVMLFIGISPLLSNFF